MREEIVEGDARYSIMSGSVECARVSIFCPPASFMYLPHWYRISFDQHIKCSKIEPHKWDMV